MYRVQVQIRKSPYLYMYQCAEVRETERMFCMGGVTACGSEPIKDEPFWVHAPVLHTVDKPRTVMLNWDDTIQIQLFEESDEGS